MVILSVPGGVELGRGYANDDGSFGPIAFGNNAAASIEAYVEDRARNRSARAPFQNDMAAQSDGRDVTITFDVNDNASNLNEAPTATIGGRASSPCTGSFATAGTTRTQTCVFRVLQAQDAAGSRPVVVSARDTAGNSATAQSTVRLDYTRPSSANATPGDRTTWSGGPAILGSAFDAESGVDRVHVSIRRQDIGQYWNGSAWQAAQAWLLAGGADEWSYSMAGMPLVNGTSYRLQWRATDRAGNE